MFLENMLENPEPITNWVNGNLYVPTAETTGILSIPSELQAESRMIKFDPNLDRKQPHAYLAEKQHTRKAILPVHTPAEIELFSTLMRNDDAFISQSSGPRWFECVRSWNSKANEQDNIFYKVRYLKIISLSISKYFTCHSSRSS